MTKARIIPVFKNGKGHIGHVDGWIVAHEDRIVREVVIEKPQPKKKPRRA